MEETLIRENLMTREGYSPYCGSNNCSFRNPRSIYDIRKEQFTCKCGWVSEFPSDFIIRYKTKWNK